MRPLRFLLLLAFFVALPVFLTCWSLFSSHESGPDSLRASYTPPSSRLRALLSFSTPSSLFPPSAVISLTNDNSTFFVARPAAFGPSLPINGLSGQLWVGRGFGDEAVLEEDGVHITGWELGCSDVPGWREDERKRIEKLAAVERPQKRSLEHLRPDGETDGSDDSFDPTDKPSDDGTDDHLHHPLPDSNPATSGKPGEPARADISDKNKKPTHADIESLQESAVISGKIALLARGGCGFLEKVKWVQRRGGIAVIVGDREKGASLTIMYAKGDTSNVTIPAIFTSYNAAHLLSSLVPSKGSSEDNMNPKVGDNKGKLQTEADKAVFTTSPSNAKPTNRPGKQDVGPAEDANGWMHDALAAIGLTDDSPWHQEDSRRPPGSGNIEWVLMDEWDEEGQAKTESKTQSKTSTKLAATSSAVIKGKSTSTRRAAGDDFVIGVQDWRDTELIAPKPKTTSTQNADGKRPKGNYPESSSSLNAPKSTQTALKGGSITPGSGEYDHQKMEQDSRVKDSSLNDKNKQRGQEGKNPQDKASAGFFSYFRASDEEEGQSSKSELKKPSKQPPQKKPKDGEDEQDGLWVTLTPTSVSTSPFFDTLLVLVVSPLVTLTVVYALLLLRSRIRRRRWRAPKSVVERLPVRTYHTMSTSSSTTSSQVSTPEHSTVTSPLLHPSTHDPAVRTRPRSQTASGAIEGTLSSSSRSLRSLSRSPPTEKAKPKSSKRKRYAGRQVECVVCLEEYVDGESRVMSLPCGHEFHADCITPWLVNRRRTCPICKGDVVRSMARANPQSVDQRQPGEETSDDIQSRAAQTTNEEPSAAIPIPARLDDSEDEDVERGQDNEESVLSQTQERQSAWRNVIARSLSRLSGDTVWRQTPTDRNR